MKNTVVLGLEGTIWSEPKIPMACKVQSFAYSFYLSAAAPPHPLSIFPSVLMSYDEKLDDQTTWFYLFRLLDQLSSSDELV